MAEPVPVDSPLTGAGQRERGSRIQTAIAAAVTAAALFLHLREATEQFTLTLSSRAWTYTNYDHPFHFYYSQRTRDFFFDRGAFWGYDPTFMAGYAKTLVFPTSSTLPECVGLVAGEHGAVAYRLFVAASLLCTPFVLAFAARVLAGQRSAGFVCFPIAVLWVWAGWPTVYTIWGMGPFIFASALSVLAGLLLAKWLDEPAAAVLGAGTLLAAIATISHPSSPVILGLMLAPAYVSRFGTLPVRAHIVAWFVPLAVIAAWSPWWLPVFILRDTYGTTASGFINENILGRLDELLRAQFPEESAMLVAVCATWAALYTTARQTILLVSSALLMGAISVAKLSQWNAPMGDSPIAHWLEAIFLTIHAALGMTGTVTLFGVLAGVMIVLFGRGRRSVEWAAVGAAIALFTITYFGSALGWMQALQPGRYTQPLYGLLIVMIAASVVRWGSDFRQSGPAALAATALTIGAAILAAPKIHAMIVAKPERLPVALPQHLVELAGYLRSQTDSSGRILFEDRGRLNVHPDPFAGTNPSALMPLLAPGQYIGGPYLYTHLKTNFTQFGDGFFFGHDVRSMDRSTFERYVRLYNVRWCVLWTPWMLRIAAAHPDLFEERAEFGLLRVFEVLREPNWAIEGSAETIASSDRIEVRNARAPESGPLVLSYHWIRTLKSTVALTPVWREDDPVPFIAVDDPPEQFVIENRLW